MTNAQQDMHLVALIKKGDDKALESLYRKYYYSLCQFASFFTNRDDLAQEIVSDVFVKLWEKRNSLTVSRNLKAYLFKATQNMAINYMKQEKNNMGDLYENIQENTHNPVEALIFKEFEHEMTAIINHLPQKRKAIFQLNRFEGFTYHEIAEILSLSVKTVENQMGKAIKQLRSMYRTQEF